MIAHSSPPPANSLPTVFILDDDEAVLNSLSFYLRVEGMNVRTFPTASQLLDVAAFPESGCLVVDLKLPDADGLDLVSTLRGRGVTLPAILITTNPTESTRRKAAAAHVVIVEKPSLGNALPDAIRNAIAKTH
ncbi:MAG TPA: response regulator [Bauldia sp.]|nr:response regulator [Bauldia sp.]